MTSKHWDAATPGERLAKRADAHTAVRRAREASQHFELAIRSEPGGELSAEELREHIQQVLTPLLRLCYDELGKYAMHERLRGDPGARREIGEALIALKPMNRTLLEIQIRASIFAEHLHLAELDAGVRTAVLHDALPRPGDLIERANLPVTPAALEHEASFFAGIRSLFALEEAEHRHDGPPAVQLAADAVERLSTPTSLTLLADNPMFRALAAEALGRRAEFSDLVLRKATGLRYTLGFRARVDVPALPEPSNPAHYRDAMNALHAAASAADVELFTLDSSGANAFTTDKARRIVDSVVKELTAYKGPRPVLEDVMHVMWSERSRVGQLLARVDALRPGVTALAPSTIAHLQQPYGPMRTRPRLPLPGSPALPTVTFAGSPFADELSKRGLLDQREDFSRTLIARLRNAFASQASSADPMMDGRPLLIELLGRPGWVNVLQSDPVARGVIVEALGTVAPDDLSVDTPTHRSTYRKLTENEPVLSLYLSTQADRAVGALQGP